LYLLIRSGEGILGQTALLEFRLLKEQQITQNVAARINEYIKGQISPVIP